MPSPLTQALAFQNSVSPTQSGIAPTDVVGAYKLASDVAEKNYMAKMAQQQAKFGGLAGLGGAGVLAFGKPAAEKLFGAGASKTAGLPAAGTDAATGTGGVADLTAPLSSGASLGDAGTFPFASLGGAQTGSLWPAFGGGVAEAGAPAAGTVAADLGAGAAADAGGAAAGGALAGLPEWLLAILPFLA